MEWWLSTSTWVGDVVGGVVVGGGNVVVVVVVVDDVVVVGAVVVAVGTVVTWGTVGGTVTRGLVVTVVGTVVTVVGAGVVAGGAVVVVACALVVGVLQTTLAVSRMPWSSVVVVRWTLVVVVPKMHTVVHGAANGEIASRSWCAANAVLSTVGSGPRRTGTVVAPGSVTVGDGGMVRMVLVVGGSVRTGAVVAGRRVVDGDASRVV